MADTQIRFDDGAAYERMMGRWSQLAGAVFLDWLDPADGLRWVDVGCGNGAFTELLVAQCAPASVDGIDPSEGQLRFARNRAGAGQAQFRQGDAMQLPYADQSFDAAVMALVLFFVPEPGRGVAEMARVIRPGGTISAYAWDILGGGFPLEAMHVELRELGIPPLYPPSVEASRLSSMRSLWSDAGLVDIQTREIVVQRSFADLDDYWTTAQAGSNVSQLLTAMPAAQRELLKTRLKQRLPADADGRITCSARANAVKGRLPA